MKSTIVIIMLALLSGCATLPKEQRIEEATYQVLNAFDAAQTYEIAANPRKWHERSALLGRHPSETSVVAYMGAEAWAHAVITQTMVNRDTPMWIQRSWAAVSIGWKADNVVRNYNIGIRLNIDGTDRIRWGH